MHLREPVLWRSPGELQVGTTGDRVLTGLEPTEIDLQFWTWRCHVPRSGWPAAHGARNPLGPLGEDPVLPARPGSVHASSAAAPSSSTPTRSA